MAIQSSKEVKEIKAEDTEKQLAKGRKVNLAAILLKTLPDLIKLINLLLE